MAIKRALISVSDKTGIVEFARALAEQGVEILSTGGTLQALRNNGVKATSVEDYTNSPEVMGGRVKTLHPRVHGGILARLPQDQVDLDKIDGEPIDLVVVNLYPFEKVAARAKADYAEIIENIDIGGPCMLRAAAKNYERVTVVCDPANYDQIIEELRQYNGELPLNNRRLLAIKAFSLTCAYDKIISDHLYFMHAAVPQRERTQY